MKRISLSILICIVSVLLAACNQKDYYDKDIKTVIALTEQEKQEVKKDVIIRLRQKYGENNVFEVVDIEKYTYKVDDVVNEQKYFNVTVKLKNGELEKEFKVDYIEKTDNLFNVLKDSYTENILKRFNNINTKINAISYTLGDYNGMANDNNKDFMSLYTIYGEIPTQSTIDSLVHHLDIYCKYPDINLEIVDSVKLFVDENKQEIKEIYEYAANEFPGISNGVGATSVEISFGNGIQMRIYPLSKNIIVVSPKIEVVEYEWKDIFE